MLLYGGPFVVEPPSLPSASSVPPRPWLQSALGDKCPNVELHRAARTTASNLSLQPDRHPLAANEVRSLVVTQLAKNMDKNCGCLDKYGCIGRCDVLFKIIATWYAYTFVATHLLPRACRRCIASCSRTRLTCTPLCTTSRGG